MFIKIGLDLGNNTICAVGKIENQFSQKYIPSTYKIADNFSTVNVVEIDGVALELGEPLGSEFTCINKTDRLYVKHQILWAIYELYASELKDSFTLDLGMGLPIDTFKDKETRLQYQEQLNQIKNITGTVNGQKLNVELNKVKLFAEGYTSVKALAKYIPKNGYPTMICDIGFLTTDVIITEYENNTIRIKNPHSINKGIGYVYDSLYLDASKVKAVTSKSELDFFVRNEYDNLRTNSSQTYPLQQELMKKTNECKSILHDISNQLNIDTTKFNKIFIGGGGVLLLKILGEKMIKNHVPISDKLRYNANAVGYFLNL